MPNPTTNPNRLARTERDVAWNPLPGDRFRYPDGLTIVCPSGNPRGLFGENVFRQRLAEAPAGSALLPYRAAPLLLPSVGLVQALLGRLRTDKVSGYPGLPAMVDRGIHNGQICLYDVPLDYSADLPEAPFIYHAANILHCMVKFGAPALVAENMRGRDNWNRHQEWQRRSLAHPKPHVTVSGHVVDESAIQITAEYLRDLRDSLRRARRGVWDYDFDWERSFRGAASDRRCPRTDPRTGDLCILPRSEFSPLRVSVYKEGSAVYAWESGPAGTVWVRAEDVVRKPGASS